MTDPITPQEWLRFREAVTRLRKPMMAGKFIASKEGRDAINKLFRAFDRFQIEYQVDLEKAEHLKKQLTRLLKADPVTYTDRPPKTPVQWDLPPRKRRAENPGQAKRMLAREKTTMSRFHFRVDRICETGEINPPTPDREQVRYENQLAMAAKEACKRAQKEFKAENIPMNFQFHDGAIFYDLVGDWVNLHERDFVNRVIDAACTSVGLAYLPEPDAGFLQYGLIFQTWSDARFNERFPCNYS